MINKFNRIGGTILLGLMTIGTGWAQSSGKPAKWVGEYQNNSQTVQLFSDNSYLITNGNMRQSGLITWQNKGTKAMLTGSNQSFDVAQGKITQTASKQEFMKIKPNMVQDIVVNSYANLTGGRWVLVELFGKKIPPAEKENKEVFLRFDGKETRYSGYSGCNSFGGILDKLDDYAIGFGKSIQTMKACIDEMEVESQLMEVIKTADNYTVNNGFLNLNKARMATMARFKWVKD